MKKISKYKVDTGITLSVILFAIISIITIYSAQSIIGEENLVFKQILWYGLGFLFAYFIRKCYLCTTR